MLTNIAIALLVALALILGILAFLSWRQPIMAKLGVRNIPRRPAQSILIIIGLTLSTIIIISSLSTGDTLNHSVTSQAVEAYGEIDEILSPPLLATLAQFGVNTSDIDSETEAENAEPLPALFQGGLTSFFALLDEGLPGISEARYAELRAKTAEEPLIESVAPAIIFPTIIRDVNSGQGEPFGFIFAVDDEYQTQFGLRTLDGEPADMARLRPGVGNIFELTAKWAVPWSSLLQGRGAIFQQEPSAVLASFALTGPLIILGAILTIIVNADALLWLVNRLFGSIGPLTPVLKIAIAYPLNARFRTGVAMLLFAMIITTVTIMAIVIKASQATIIPAAERSAGFEIEVSPTLLSFFNPIADLAAEIARQPDFPTSDVTAVARISRFDTAAQQLGSRADNAVHSELLLTGLNQDYFEQAQHVYTFLTRAPGFESDAAVWQALHERDDVAIVSAQIVADEVAIAERDEASAEDTAINASEDALSNGSANALDLPRLHLSGLTLPDAPTSVAPMPEILIELQSLAAFQSAETAAPQTVQVIGVLAQNTTLAGGVFQVNERLIERLSGATITPDNFYVKVHEGADVKTVAQTIERAFLSGGLNATVMAESFAAGQALTRGILQLFQGFMALGLLVGIAALGVISSRTVVERRQQVGMLRAIGYQPRMVALLFVLESSFIALCGLGIGAITGLILGQNIIAEFYAFVTEGQGFRMPWLQIGLILLGTYLFAMLTTIVPAIRASRIYPAEALRYS